MLDFSSISFFIPTTNHVDFVGLTQTIGAYFATKTIHTKTQSVQMAIWDTAGEEKFDSLTNFYCRGAKAALVVYDVGDKKSFSNLQRWIKKINTEADENCAVILVGNKCDVVESGEGQREVALEEAKAFGATINAGVMEVSAKTGLNIVEVFQKVVELCISRNLIGEKGSKSSTQLKGSEAAESKCC